MIEVSVHEAKTQLSRLLDLGQNGEEVLIHRGTVSPSRAWRRPRPPRNLRLGLCAASSSCRKAGTGRSLRTKRMSSGGWWTRAAALFHGRVLPIRATHVTALAALPDLHRDPFEPHAHCGVDG